MSNCLHHAHWGKMLPKAIFKYIPISFHLTNIFTMVLVWWTSYVVRIYLLLNCWTNQKFRDKNGQKICQKVPKFNFLRRYIPEPGKAYLVHYNDYISFTTKYFGKCKKTFQHFRKYSATMYMRALYSIVYQRWLSKGTFSPRLFWFLTYNLLRILKHVG